MGIDENGNSKQLMLPPVKDDGTYKFFEGVIYVGEVIVNKDPTCYQFRDLFVAFQFVNQSSWLGPPLMVGGVITNYKYNSTLTTYNIGCMGQFAYILDGSNTKLVDQPVNDPSNVKFANCSLGAAEDGHTYTSLDGVWDISPDFSTFT